MECEEAEMPDPRVECPKCGHSFAVTKALTEQLEATIRSDFERKGKELEKSFRLKLESEVSDATATATKAAEKTAAQKMGELEKQLTEAESREKASKKDFEKQLQKALDLEKAQLAAQAKKDAKESVEEDLQKLKARLKEGEKKEKELKQATIALEDKRSALERKELRLDAEVSEAREEAAKKVAESYRQQELEHNKVVADMKKQMTELRTKLDQRSQQLQGEVREVELEELLAQVCPDDEISPVKAGKRGADVIQRVISPGGQHCGTIVWEMKNAKNWAKTWITKLKTDQRKIKAELAVLVSKALPPGLESGFGQIERVWVCGFETVPGLALVLRQHLVEMSSLARSAESKDDKMEVLYKYLMSTAFRQRVEAIVESFQGMRQDLDREKSAMEKMWAKREAQIGQVVLSISGMVGDIQGIAPAFPDIKRLELPSPG